MHVIATLTLMVVSSVASAERDYTYLNGIAVQNIAGELQNVYGGNSYNWIVENDSVLGFTNGELYFQRVMDDDGVNSLLDVNTGQPSTDDDIWSGGVIETIVTVKAANYAHDFGYSTFDQYGNRQDYTLIADTQEGKSTGTLTLADQFAWRIDVDEAEYGDDQYSWWSNPSIANDTHPEKQPGDPEYLFDHMITFEVTYAEALPDGSFGPGDDYEGLKTWLLAWEDLSALESINRWPSEPDYDDIMIQIQANSTADVPAPLAALGGMLLFGIVAIRRHRLV